ncbi:conserved hypothetical protein [Rhodopseudomonas palustris HaA2]|uniref:Uncharacterized protein n=2 Tax=Rhodopseudomonas palustris TaxID=1076 RepID=Q2IXZ5_RHOP2|nr:conserved hypothetical protein [Rhodopseudomonas palustris HaA2]
MSGDVRASDSADRGDIEVAVFAINRLGVRSCVLALCLFSVCAGGMKTAAAQSMDYRSPAAAPPSWTQFAKLVQYRFESWISDDEEIANRFRAHVVERAGKPGGLPPTLVVRAWLNPDGTVEKIAFPALNDARAEADLRTILMRGNVGEPPPPEMLQPLNLQFSLNLKK